MDDPPEDAEGAQSSTKCRCTVWKVPSRNASQETNRSTDSDFVDARSKNPKAAAIKSSKPISRTATKPVPTTVAKVRPSPPPPPIPPHILSYDNDFVSAFLSFFCVPSVT